MGEDRAEGDLRKGGGDRLLKLLFILQKFPRSMTTMTLRITFCAAMILALSGCAAIPLATGLALGVAAVGAGGLVLSGIHDCKQDGGCKAVPLPP